MPLSHFTSHLTSTIPLTWRAKPDHGWVIPGEGEHMRAPRYMLRYLTRGLNTWRPSEPVHQSVFPGRAPRAGPHPIPNGRNNDSGVARHAFLIDNCRA
jgi:hypothetical protein